MRRLHSLNHPEQRLLRSVCKLLAMLCLLAPAAHALETPLALSAWQLVETRTDAVSLSEAAELVQRRTAGRVLSAQTGSAQGREVHRIKILLPNGEVRVVWVDASTGRLD